MKIKKAVIPAAGFGTRVLPASKAIPKEMLPIVDKPVIEYIVREAVESGIEEILIILSRGKTAVEDHFDRAPELEQALLSRNRKQAYQEIVSLSNLAKITYIRQKEPKGLGDAVLCAKSFAAGEPIAVMYGDDVTRSHYPVCKQLCDAYEEYGLGVVGIKEVSEEEIHRYSSLKVTPLQNRLFKISDMIEKPNPDQVLSLYSILGRCVLPYKIFDILEKTLPGAGNEIQLTDAMKELARSEGMIGVDFIGKRYDMGNKLGILEAITEFGLAHEEIGKDFRLYLEKLIHSQQGGSKNHG